jgi:hypothetical protein
MAALLGSVALQRCELEYGGMAVQLNGAQGRTLHSLDFFECS